MAELFDADLEVNTLASIMQRPDLYEQMVEVLTPEDFGDPVLGQIYARMGDMRAENMEINAATLYHRCKDMVSAMDGLGGIQLFINLSTYGIWHLGQATTNAELVADLARRRRAVGAVEATLSKVKALQIRTADDAAIELERALDALMERRDGSSSSFAADCMAQIVAENLEAQSGKNPGVILKHFPEFSKVVGPMMPTEFTVLAGRPSMGKTGVGMKVATSAARQGDGVLYLSQEMRKPEIMARGAADLLYKGRDDDIPYSQFTNMTLTREQMQRVEKLGEVLSDWPLIIDDKASHTLTTIGAAARKAARQFERQGKKLKIVIVDHLQLMGSEERNATAYAKATDNSRGMKRLAKALNCHVLALSQMSRKVEEREDKRPQMDDLRDTGAIEEDANNVVMLYRHEYYLQKQRVPGMPEPGLEQRIEECKGVLEILGRKIRNGGPRDEVVNFITKYQAFRSFEKPDTMPF